MFQYPISRRIEWLGSSKALFLGSFFYGIGFLSFSWVKSFTPVVGSIAVLVTGEMLFVPTSYAIIGNISKPEDRTKNMGLTGLCTTIGSSFGPLLGGFLLDKFHTKPLWVWGPVALPAFLAALSFILWKGYMRTGVAGSTISDKPIKDVIIQHHKHKKEYENGRKGQDLQVSESSRDTITDKNIPTGTTS
jgi:MFS family permease